MKYQQAPARLGLRLSLWAALGCLLVGLCVVSPAAARSKKKPRDSTMTEAPAEPAVPAAPAEPAPKPLSPQPPTAEESKTSPAAKTGGQGSSDPCLSDPTCNEMYERARTLSKANQYEAALVLYQQTFAMRPLPWLLLNVGRMQQKIGRHDQAVGTFRKLLDWNAKQPEDDQSNLADEEVLAKAREYRTQAETAIAEQQKQNPGAMASGPPVDQTPITRKWWFWTIVGGTVVVGAGLAVGLGVGLSNTSAGNRVGSGVPVLYPTF